MNAPLAVSEIISDLSLLFSFNNNFKRNTHVVDARPGRIQFKMLGGRAISVMFGRQVSQRRCYYCRRDEVRFATLLYETIDERIALHRNR